MIPHEQTPTGEVPELLERPPTYFVYLLKCADDTYYTGMTGDLKNRLRRHMQGADKRAYTYSRRPVRLVWSEAQPSKELAKAREKAIKRLSRRGKDKLVHSMDNDTSVES